VPAALPRPLRGAPAQTAGSAPFNYAYVGTYTPNGGGIYLFRIDPVTAALTQLQVIDDIRNPTWLAVNPAKDRLYAVSEIDNFQGTRNGAVVSYAIDNDSLQLKRLGAVSSGGTTPAHASVHPSGKFVFVANYGGGNVAVFPVGAAWVHGIMCAPPLTQRGSLASATTRARIYTWSRPIRAGNS
jgi:6-phosphogluconolactonase